MSGLKVGLAGCGRIARLVHLGILTRMPGVQLVAVAEPHPQRREEARDRAPGAIAFADYRELLAMAEVDAVVLCLPNALHAEAAVAALEHGKHVYLEKPLGTSLREARRVLAAWRCESMVGMIGFNYRFNALYRAARRYIESGQLGEMLCARSVFSRAATTLPAWGHTRQTGGGALLDLASHHVDLVHFLFGQEVREVFAVLQSRLNEDDSAMVHLRLARGLLVQSFFSTSAVEEDRFEIYGQAGKLTVDRHLGLDVEVTDPSLQFARLKRVARGLRSLLRSPYLLQKIRAPAYEPSYRAALEHFVAAARTNRSASPDFRDGYTSLSVIEGAELSARTGRAVSLPECAVEDSAR